MSFTIWKQLLVLKLQLLYFFTFFMFLSNPVERVVQIEYIEMKDENPQVDEINCTKDK